MKDSQDSVRGISCQPPRVLLEQIDLQIAVYECKLKALKMLKIKLSIDPELEDVLVETRNLFKS